MRTSTTRALLGTLITLGAALVAPATALTDSTSVARPAPATTATGPDGFTSCSAFLAERNKMFYSQAFAADSLRSSELAYGFAAMLREKAYAAASSYAPKDSPPPPLTVDCRWHRTKDGALDWNKRLIAGARRNGMDAMLTPFDPI